MVNEILLGDAKQRLSELKDNSIDCIITSPPYWALRDYGVAGQLGLEPTVEQYIENLCAIFDECKRVLKKSGTCWVNLGDTYMGNSSFSSKGRQGFEEKEGSMNKKQWLDPKYPHKEKLRAREHVLPSNIPNKSLCMIPFRFALEMVKRGWILRNTIIWHKPNCMPSSVKDRFTVDFEYLFFFTKNQRYFFEPQYEAHIGADKEKRSKIKGGKESRGKTASGRYATTRVSYGEKGRNKRTVWNIPTSPFPEAHFATYPEALCEIPIKAGCPEGGIVLDPFFGAGTTGLVALKNNRSFIGIELNPEYIKIAKERLKPYLEQRKLSWTLSSRI